MAVITPKLNSALQKQLEGLNDDLPGLKVFRNTLYLMRVYGGLEPGELDEIMGKATKREVELSKDV